MIRRVTLLIILTQIISYASEKELVALALKKKLYNQARWKALLHYNNNFNIKNNKFIHTDNLKNELIYTIKSFYNTKSKYKNSNEHPQCLFPARFLFIKKSLNVNKTEFPDVNCTAFNTYLQKAPANQISLIYASEKVNNPSSMMGHTFFKLSGMNNSKRYVEHAVSFYTIINTINPLKLAYQNIYAGMQGIFSLRPYQETLLKYLNEEDRNIWEYNLKLTNYERKLMYYHLWELKDIKMHYYLTSYNCSTVVYYILSLANPKIYNEKEIWMTPLETVKILYKYNLIKNAKLIPSKNWYIKMLEEQVSSKDEYTIYNIVNTNKDISKLKFNTYTSKLLYAYAEYEYSKKQLSQQKLTEIESHIPKKLLDKTIDISHYKSPQKLPNERQLSVGYKNINKTNFMNLTFLPASHLITDNNREYFGESELKIGYLSLLLNKETIKLDDFTLYGMKSYTPYDLLTKNLSYQFELAIKKDYTLKSKYKDTFKFDGGIGFDFKVTYDINIFTILNAGIGYNNEDNTHLFLNPEVGFMIYEIFNMKSVVIYQPLYKKSKQIYNQYMIMHTIFLNKFSKISLDYKYLTGRINQKNFSISASWLF